MTDGEIRQRAGMALQYMLHDYSRFRVETIDSFFQSVMRNLARELELSPNLNIELNNSEVLSDAVDSLIEKLTPHFSRAGHGSWTTSTSASATTNAGTYRMR